MAAWLRMCACAVKALGVHARVLGENAMLGIFRLIDFNTPTQQPCNSDTCRPTTATRPRQALAIWTGVGSAPPAPRCSIAPHSSSQEERV